LSVGEEGAVVVAGGAAADLLGGDEEPNDVAELAEDLAVLRAGDDASSGGDDVFFGFLGDEILENAGFHVSKDLLALVGEDVFDRFAGPFDEEGIGI
jgi:hypothetical protein